MNENQLFSIIRQLDNKITNLESYIQSIKIQQDVPASLPGQYPGKPIPDIEGCEIAIATNTNISQGNIVLSADGPFLARAIHFCFRPTAGNQTGLWRPISSARSSDVGNDDDVINFYWEYQVTGSHRNRQNTPVPSAIPHQAEEGHGYFDFHVEDVFEASSTVSIRITLTVAPKNAGVMFVGFSGAYLLK